MSYLANSDITDKVVTPFLTKDATQWAAIMARTDAQVEDFAESIGVYSGEIVTPIHNTIKDWAIAYFCAQVCKDAAEVNDLEGGEDKYMAKFRLHMGEMLRLQKLITPEMFRKEVYGRGDRVQEGILFRV